MKVGTSRFAVVAVITGWLLVAGSASAWAFDCSLTAPNYPTNFSADHDCLVLNGTNPGTSPGFAGDTSQVLRLTTAPNNQRAGVWFNTKQPVQNGFSTTFRFQLSGGTGADGIAFVIQNFGSTAIGSPPNGGALGYGDHDTNADPSSETAEGIAKSLAIEFDTFHNDWDPAGSHVAVQSCGAGKNTSHHQRNCSATGPNSTLAGPLSAPSLVNGAIHKVTVTYAPPPATCAVTPCLGSLHVILDDTDLFPDGVATDLNSIQLSDGAAFLGFTAATGGAVQNQDILTWTFTPTSQSTVVQQGETSVVPFQNDAYNYTAVLNSGNATTLQVTPKVMDPTACDTLVQKNPLFQGPNGAHCFVYQNALGLGQDKAVLFEVTCPQLSSTAECSPLDADLGTQFDLSSNNPNFDPTNPFPGWLKGNGGVPGFPCTPNSDPNIPLFQSNQINFFALTRIDPFTKGKSGGTGSCWVATYNTPNEAPTVTIAAPLNNGIYQQNQNDPTTKASYACHTVDTTPSATGPYLTQTSCSATDTPGGSVASGAQFDTTIVGLHTFKATVVDSGTDNASATVSYNVVGAADLKISKSTVSKIQVNSKLIYAVIVTNLSPNPNPTSALGVTVTDPLPANTTFVSASGVNNACRTVSGRLSCTITSVPCSLGAGNVVSCNLGTVAPLASWFLNGVAIQITVGVKNVPLNTTITNVATVKELNADPNGGNNSSSASTTVVAH